MLIAINYGRQKFIVDVTEGSVKQLFLTVHPDLKITAKVPKGFDQKTIEKRLQKKASWIAKQIDYFPELHSLSPERKYVSGETHYYLGRQYRLKIQESQLSEIKLKGRFFIIKLPSVQNSGQVKKLMHTWYVQHANLIFNQRIEKYLPYFIKLGVKKPIVKMRKMNKRWGSCNKHGKVIFNMDLIKAPIHCIDYVIVHELCHQLSFKHDNKFYYLLEKILPDWKVCKERLEKTTL